MGGAARGNLATRLLGAVPCYASLAWWGLISPRLGQSAPLVLHQGVVLRERQVLLTLRHDLRGWELPGGEERPGEAGEAALRREVHEETGLEVVVERRVGTYRRTGFRPHTAHVYCCRPVGGTPRPSPETPDVRWFDAEAPPATLFPWYRASLADALAGSAPVERKEHWGLRAVLTGLAIDLRMRTSDDSAGLTPPRIP